MEPAGAVTVPTGTTAIVATAYFAEPNITATGTVTLASTVYIADAPTEGGSNYSLYVAAGLVHFAGGISLTPPITLTEDGGAMKLIDFSVTATPAAGVEQSYTFEIDDQEIMKVYATADSAGGLQAGYGVLVSGVSRLYFNDIGGEYLSGDGSTLTVTGAVSFADTSITVASGVNIDSAGAINFRPSGDVDDYLTVTTVSDVVTLTATGSTFNFVGAMETDGITAVGEIAATVGIKVSDDQYVALGGGVDAIQRYETADANALMIHFLLPDSAQNANNVPVIVFNSRTINGADLGTTYGLDFSGRTEPVVAVADDDADSAICLGFAADDDAQLILMGSAALTLPAFTAGGSIAMGDNSVTGIDTLTFTDTAGTVAGIQNQNLVDKAATEAIAGAWTYSATVTIAGTTPPDLILDNTTTGADASSGVLYFRGHDDTNNAEVEGKIWLVGGADPYLRVSVDDGGAAPASVAVFDIHDTIMVCNVNGFSIATHTDDNDSIVFQAYDVDGAAYATLIEIKSANVVEMGFFGVTPVARPSAWTQTYATADKTVANPTGATLTDNSGGGATDNTIGVIAIGGNVGQDIPDAIAELADEINKLVADNLDLRQAVTALIDDQQALGLAQ